MKNRFLFIGILGLFILILNFMTYGNGFAKVGPAYYNVDVYKQLIEENPDTEIAIEAYMCIGLKSSYHIYAEYEAAEEAYRFIVEHYPKSPYADDALWYLARLYEWNLEEFKEAISIYQEILNKYGKVCFEVNPAFHDKPGRDLSKEAIERKVDDLTTKVREIETVETKIREDASSKETIGLYFRIVDLYVDLGGLKRAVEILEDVTERFSSSNHVVSKAFFYLGNIYANDWIERISDPLGRYLFGVSSHYDVSRKTQLLRISLVKFKLVVDKYPKSEWAPKALFEMGRVYRQIGYKWVPDKKMTDHRIEIVGNYDEAIKVFKQLVSQYPESDLKGPALLQLGLSYKDSGKYPEAKRIFEEIARSYAGSEVASRALAEIDKIGK
jgi:outer membrane protein assembly factor BamD (BamD/ComL family)